MPQDSGLLSRWEKIWARWAGTWALEIVAITLSIGTLGALVVILIVGNGKNLWNGITLNTYVSILATVSKLAALFALSSAIGQTKWNLFRHRPGSLLDFEAIDLASRGAFGCAQLLCQRRSVALLGALAFIIAFAFDPFAQQLVQYEMQMDFVDNLNVTAPVKERYSAGILSSLGATYDDETEARYILPNVDFGMQAAILSGLVQDDDLITQQLSLTCPSGNCTWPPMQSLAVCSVCNDLTSYLRRSWSVNETTGTYMTLGALQFGNNTIFRLPNHLRLDNMKDTDPYLMMTSLGTAIPKQTVTMSSIDTLIWSMSMLRANPNPNNASAVWPDFPIEAKECALYYCVKEYNVTVTGNRIIEESHEVLSQKRAKDSWQPVAWPGRKFNQTMLESLSWSTNGSSGWASANRTDLMLGTKFNISDSAVDSTSMYFWQMFTTSTSMPPINGYYIDWESTANYGPSVMQILYRSSDWASRFSTLAKSMSNAIRIHEADVIHKIGKLGQPHTKYRIEWPWITLPIVVVLASLVQLLVTMKASKRLPLWKSSILAVLSRGLVVGDTFEGADTVEALRDAAARKEVYLFEESLPSTRLRAEKYLMSISSGTTLQSTENRMAHRDSSSTSVSENDLAAREHLLDENSMVQPHQTQL